MWVGNSQIRVQSLRDCYKYPAHTLSFAYVGFDDDDDDDEEQGVQAWKIPLHSGCGHIWCRIFLSQERVDIVGSFTKRA